MAAVLKTAVPERVSGVRIPLPPPVLASLGPGGGSGLQAPRDSQARRDGARIPFRFASPDGRRERFPGHAATRLRLVASGLESQSSVDRSRRSVLAVEPPSDAARRAGSSRRGTNPFPLRLARWPEGAVSRARRNSPSARCERARIPILSRPLTTFGAGGGAAFRRRATRRLVATGYESLSASPRPMAGGSGFQGTPQLAFGSLRAGSNPNPQSTAHDVRCWRWSRLQTPRDSQARRDGVRIPFRFASLDGRREWFPGTPQLAFGSLRAGSNPNPQPTAHDVRCWRWSRLQTPRDSQARRDGVTNPFPLRLARRPEGVVSRARRNSPSARCERARIPLPQPSPNSAPDFSAFPT